MPNEPFMILLAVGIFLSMFILPDYTIAAVVAFLITFVMNLARGVDCGGNDGGDNGHAFPHREFSPVRIKAMRSPHRS